jgi:uncharacterized protein with NRDE domain
MLIESDNYGTRSTSVLTQRVDGWTEFLELARGPDAAAPRRFGFQVGSGAQTQPRSTRERALSQPER